MKGLVGLFGGFALFCFAGVAYGSGFALYEWSTAGDGMAGATLAGGIGVDAMGANPASITQVKSSGWSAGTSWINPTGQVRFSDGTVQYNVKDPALVPYFYYGKKLSDNRWFGLTVQSRFGLSSKFDPDWKGRYNSYHAEVKSLSVTPTYGFKVGELSVAVGIEAMYLDFRKRKKIATPMGDLDADVQADNTAWGWNLGLRWDMSERTSLGAVYRSKVTQDVTGDARFSGVPSTSAWGSVTLPDSLSLGISHWVTDRTRVEVDGIFTRWSSYDALTINYGRPLNPADPGSNVTSEEKGWRDVWRYQLGVEHRVNDRWSVMAGYVYDCSPIPDGMVDFMVPTGDRQTYSVGVTYRNKDLSGSLSYGRMIIDERDVLYDGTGGGSLLNARVEDMKSDIIGLSVQIRL